MMEELKQAIALALNKRKEDCGEDATIEDGDAFVTTFDNFYLLISIDGGELNSQFIQGKPYKVEGFSLNLFDCQDLLGG